MEFFMVLVVCVAAAYGLYRMYKLSEAEAQRKAQAEASLERHRIEECGEVVRRFANTYGYLARSVVTRDELEGQIDSGASADDLRALLVNRMLSVNGIELGEHGSGLPVILQTQHRDKHVYVVGKSGYGKTNLLRYLIIQDFLAGNGVGILAPEVEMIEEELLPFVPEDRVDDAIYFNPADVDCPVVLNPLHLEEGEDIDLHVDETFTVLQRIVGEGGPRMDEILRHSLYALTERPNSTLMDIERLLDRQDDSFRQEVIHRTTDEQTLRFFSHTYPQLPKDSHFPIVNRISRIVRGKYVRNCLCPPQTTSLSEEDANKRLLNIRRAMDEGKILLFNLSDGILGEAASQLIGQLIVSKFQIATMSRANVNKAKRRPFYLYLDEFQNFCGVASKSYEKILSRARKYGLGLVLAHQQTGQIPLELQREIFGNVSTLVSFQVSQADAVRLSKEFITQYDLDIEPLPPEELLTLKIGEAYCRIGKTTFPMWVPKVDTTSECDTSKQVVERSRSKYGIPRQKLPDKSTDLRPDSRTDPLEDIDPGEVF